MPLPDEENQNFPPVEPDGLEYEPADNTQRNIMDKLRAVRDEQTDGVTCHIAVPGYRGLMKAEYGVIPTKQLSMIGKKVSRQFKADDDRQLNAIIDTLIGACEGLHFVEEDGSMTPIDPDKSGVALTYTDPRTAEYFGIQMETPSARTCLMGVFANNEPSILAHGMKLSKWYEDTSKDVDESFLGE